MTYKRFEEIPVWNDAIDLAADIFGLSSAGAFRSFSGLRDQIERAVVSVSNNIAEGFDRGTNGELLTFLYIARGSAAEVRSMLCLLERIGTSADATRAIAAAMKAGDSISRQLGGWIESIKSSGLEGNRSQTDQTRQQRAQVRRRDEFLETLREVQSRGAAGGQHPKPQSREPS